MGDLWVQEKQRLGEITYGKVDGKFNPADAMTKPVDSETMRRHLSFMGFIEASGRNKLAPELIGK